MFYYLSLELSDQISGLNVFRYITFRTGGALMTSLFLVFMFGPWLISNLRVKQGRGQPIREDGPARHIIEKQGTPTMGGLMILAGIVISTLLWADLNNLYVWSVLFVTLGFGAIGFYDDYLKVTRSAVGGFSGRDVDLGVTLEVPRDAFVRFSCRDVDFGVTVEAPREVDAVVLRWDDADFGVTVVALRETDGGSTGWDVDFGFTVAVPRGDTDGG